MAIQFPDAPTQGQSFVASNGVSYTYDNGGWIANSQLGLDDRYVNLDGDTMTGDLTVPSLNGGPLAGMRNQIINGGMQVSQRGSTGTITGGYTADRWLVYPRTNGQTVTWSIDPVKTSDVPNVPISSYLRLRTAAGQNGWNFEQRIELPATNNVSPFDEGTSWTLSFWAYSAYSLSLNISLQLMETGVFTGSSQVYSDQYSDQGVTPITNSWTKYTFNFSNIPAFTSIPTNANSCRLKFGGPLNGDQTDFYISNVQLEPGTVVTPFEMRPIGTELALCQRYYQDLQVRRINSETNWYTLPVKMRVRPTTSTDIGANIYDDSFGVIAGAAGRINVQFDAEL